MILIIIIIIIIIIAITIITIIKALIETSRCSIDFLQYMPANIDLFKVNNRNTRKRCEICSELFSLH